jgi:hypothetical protein
MAAPTAPREWPALPYADWAPTKKTLHLYTQIAGKIRLALEPPKPEWIGTALYTTARGLTTSPMPWGTASVEVTFDFYDHAISVFCSDGRARTIPLAPARCVADVYADVTGALSDLGVSVEIWTKPQEVPDTTPLEENRHDRTYEPEQAQTFFRVLTAIGNVFDEWSSRFFGRTSTQFWWGSCDLSVLLFNGKHAEPPADANYIMRYDLDAEHMTAGFWPGGDDSPVPIFYAYIYPQTPGAEKAAIDPEAAAWSDQMREWILCYDDVRGARDPRQALMQFLDSVYAAAGKLGGWDLSSFEYTAPPRAPQ